MASRDALIAFQKVEGLKRTGQLTQLDFAALMAAHRPAPRETGEAHIEVDLIRQVLFIVDETGTVTRICLFPLAAERVPFRKGGRVTPSPSRTVPGSIQIPDEEKSAGQTLLPCLLYVRNGDSWLSIRAGQTRQSWLRANSMFAAKEMFQTLPVACLSSSTMKHRNASRARD